MLEDMMKTVRAEEAKAAERVAEAKSLAKADVAAANDECRAALAKAQAQMHDTLVAAREKNAADSEKTLLDARGMAKATVQATGELLKPKIAEAAKAVLGGIVEQWQ